MKNRLSALYIVALVSAPVLLSAAAVCILCFFIPRMPFANASAAPEYRIQAASGTTMYAVGKELKKNGIIRSSRFFYLYARLHRTNLKAGIYKVNSTMSIRKICALLNSGKQEYISVAIAEGLTLNKTAALLEAKGVTNAQEFKKAAQDPSLLKKFNISAASFEGYLFPDTYNFDPLMKPEKVIDILVHTFFSKIADISELKGKTPEELHKVVILASIVEREYRVKEEAALIASVFTNRLKDNIGLYSCATVEYILTELQGKAHPELIKIEDTKIDNPYNTYKWAGLPPGPISNPGLTALKAAAAPPQTGYYYFRLTDAQKGTHSFSADFDNHKKAGTDMLGASGTIRTKKAAGSVQDVQK